MKHPHSFTKSLATDIPRYLVAVAVPLLLAVIARVFDNDREKIVWVAAIGAALVFMIWMISIFVLWINNKAEEKKNKSIEKNSAFDVFRFKPYGSEDRDTFFRPDNVQKSLINWVRSNEEPILYLTGPSGAGKTSLLRAWLVPEFEKKTSEVNVWNFDNLGLLEDHAQKGEVDGSPPQGISRLIDFIEKKISDVMPDNLKDDNSDSIRDLLERAANLSPGRLIVAIDQFGSSLLIKNDKERERFASFFEDLKERPIKGLTLLLVMRSDRRDLGNLPLLKLPETTQPGNRFEIHPLLHHEAIELLEHIAEDLSPDQRERIIEEAKESDQGLIRPVTLNIAGKGLQGAAEAAPYGRLIETYLRQLLTRPGYEEYVPKILDAMITRQSGTQPTTLSKLAVHIGTDEITIQKLLLSLQKEGLVRSLDAPTDKTWEITHSFLAEQLDRIIPRLRPNWLDRIQRGMLPVAIGSIVLFLAVGIPKFIENRRVSGIQEQGISITKESGFYAVVLKGKDQIDRIEDVEKIGSLITSLEISHGKNMPNIPNLDKFENLQKLTIQNNDEVIYIDNFGKLDSLNTFVIYNNDKLEKVEVIQNLPNLEILDVSFNANLYSLPDLNSLKNLEVLIIRNNDSLEKVPSVQSIDSLKELWIMNNRILAEIPELGNISRFTEIALGSFIDEDEDKKDPWFNKTLELLYKAPEETTILVSRDTLRRDWKKQLNSLRSELNLQNATVEPW